ncbi:c-type cytochrome [Serratia fonticola]|uniref:c-type cytochrome n=1 Tax=Serratia fonticola TaxID=47917 RepID=UPI00217B3AB2|nr:cytochrome c [Serratia fonticola]CAI1558379.1 Gluconate 2-dehydrogenase cytochrome c subunit precursor [Serratia fonticola]CAI1623147.1 Gluconate 2-dehydrogenase cytochrome c subunit precursor [Serratia fonticola]CAI1752997.1 Gluconate 2-dehydrogenase cytochrome c subunit precursor [Serratia fonticola]CAI1777305.1 Gluconate 2-dehydrogenase cytochrome c subunit precursor [Serratia fonticola]
MKKRLALLIVLIAAIVIAVLWWRENRSYDGPVQQVTSSSEQIARGRYLTQAADCAACHTAAGGAPLAGGYPLDTPFGTIYGSNLTPSADQGIGRWTKDDFFLALTQGVAPGGRHLYPAMPYTSYKGISREDADAIYAYLMSRPAVDVAIPANDMPFPFNQRMALIGWNLLFRNSDPLPASSQGSSAEWQRGRYLSDVLGHCGECHTPRGMLGQMEVNKPMQGGDLGRFIAPDITPQALAQRGWTPEDLSRFLSTGLAPQGSAFSEMHMVVDLSTRHLTPEDHRALVTYLMGDKPPQPVAAKIGQGSDAGRITYLDQCSACHERDGAGIPHVAVAMRDNATLRQPDGKNLIVSVLDGLPAQQFPGNESMQSMPGFADRLDDAQIAELVNYLRVTWGGLPADITAEQVKALRKAH